MLTALTIRDVVLIEALTIEFRAGLCVLTGETGAGKSILLDSLGLALGVRADAGLVRAGSTQAAVTAAFEVAADHPARVAIREAGLDDQEVLLLRRVLKADGGSRAFVNDQPVGAALLRDIGASLVEVHGQQDDRGLLNPRGHLALLDSFGRLDSEVAGVAALHRAWMEAKREAVDAEAALEAAARDREWLEHAEAELRALKPEPGEEQRLADQRQAMLKGERMAGDLAAVIGLVSNNDGGGLPALRQAARRLERFAGDDQRLADALAALDRAIDSGTIAEDLLARTGQALLFDPAVLEAAEARLFALRAAARKHKLAADALPELASTLAERLARLDAGAERLAAARQAVDAARAVFAQAARALSSKRQAAAARLDAAVLAELAPLKLEAARFHTALMALEEAQWHAQGADRAEFTVSTNPGAPFGGLTRIASGGELSRFILALKVALAGEGSATTLIFDEIDRGVGGAVAQAIGDRLARLGGSAQVLVVTHSPQVAARGDAQWRIEKGDSGEGVRTRVVLLGAEERREEIARMLSGETITAEARAQGARLLERLE